MSEALIKGETHLSKRDKRALMEMDLSQFDAVFREGYDNDYFKRDLTALYALFTIGHLVYGATYGRLYFSDEDFEEKVEDEGVPYYDEIDTSIHETYEMVRPRKRVLILVLSPVLAAFLLGLASVPFQLILPRVAPNLIPVLTFVATFAVIFLFGFAWALAYFMMIVDEVMYDRDEKMAEEILRNTEKEDYESILVTCGGNHRPGIASHLEKEGWKTEEETTHSPIGKILLWVDRLFGAVMSPITTVKKGYSRIRNLM